MAEIFDRRLYRETHSTFEAYGWDRWQLKKSHVYQLVNASRVVSVLEEKSAIADKFKNEAQVRPLLKLPEEKWGEG